MSPRHFTKAMFSRQSQAEREMEERVEHAISFAFSPVRHPIKVSKNILRFFKRDKRQSES
jgi:hypothetical protein